MKDVKINIQWEINVPIFRNPIILKQLGMALGIPFGLIALILLISTEGEILNDTGVLYGLGLVGVLLGLTFILIKALYGGKYAAGFIIDAEGILNYTQEKQARKNLIINILTITLGLLKGKPAAAGAGLLAQSRQTSFLKWERIKKVKYYPGSYTILLTGGFAETIALFCAKEDYREIAAVIKARTGAIAKSGWGAND